MQITWKERTWLKLHNKFSKGQPTCSSRGGLPFTSSTLSSQSNTSLKKFLLSLKISSKTRGTVSTWNLFSPTSTLQEGQATWRKWSSFMSITFISSPPSLPLPSSKFSLENYPRWATTNLRKNKRRATPPWNFLQVLKRMKWKTWIRSQEKKSLFLWSITQGFSSTIVTLLRKPAKFTTNSFLIVLPSPSGSLTSLLRLKRANLLVWISLSPFWLFITFD